MDRIYVLVRILVATHVHMVSGNKNILRVYNGVNADQSQYPYVVCLMTRYIFKFDYGQRICSGSLLNANWVLSASHCIMPLVAYIQYGNMSVPLGYTESKSKVLKMIKHPRYIEAATVNDVGLVLVKPVILSKYGSVSAVDYKTLLGQAVEFAGYGRSFITKRKTRDKLLKLIMDMVRPLQIGEAVVKPCEFPFGNNLICLSWKCSRKQIVLPGDSGGPLLSDNKIVGVAFSVLVDYSGESFTPISPHLTWINHIMSNTTILN